MYWCIPRADDGHSLDFAAAAASSVVCGAYCRLCCVYKCGCVSAWLAKEKRNEAEEKAFMSKPSINIMMGQEKYSSAETDRADGTGKLAVQNVPSTPPKDDLEWIE